MASERVVAVRQYFAESARICKQQVAHLPKGQRGPAYRQCIAQRMRALGRNPVGPG